MIVHMRRGREKRSRSKNTWGKISTQEKPEKPEERGSDITRKGACASEKCGVGEGKNRCLWKETQRVQSGGSFDLSTGFIERRSGVKIVTS